MALQTLLVITILSIAAQNGVHAGLVSDEGVFRFRGSSNTELERHPTVDSKNIAVTSLKRSDVNEASAVMARAFANSPSYNFILSAFDDEDSRVRVLTWVFRKNLKMLLDRCPSICRCVKLDGKIVATLMWTPVQHEEIDLWTILSYGGALEMPFRLGWTGFKNLLRTVDNFKEAWGEIMQTLRQDDSVILERMAVLPEYQGQGIGSTALRQVLAQTTGMVRLSTQEEQNKRFYEKLGFQVVAERDFGEGTKTYHSWFMVQECNADKN